MTIIKARASAGYIELYCPSRSAETSIPGDPAQTLDDGTDDQCKGAGEDASAAQVEALRQALEASKAEISAVRREALEEGRQLGLSEAAERESERLRALEASLHAAQTALDEHLAERQAQAIVLAKTALSRILGDSSRFADMVAETVTLWRQRLADTTLLRVIVSHADFPSDADLNLLQARLGGMEIVRDEAFESGDCKFILSMGEVDLSLPRQAAAVDRMLAQHAFEGAAP